MNIQQKVELLFNGAKFYELEARYDSRMSFYGKAHVIVEQDGWETLLSYETPVAIWTTDNKLIVNVFENWGECTYTTGRHIREFARQHGITIKKIEDKVYE